MRCARSWLDTFSHFSQSINSFPCMSTLHIDRSNHSLKTAYKCRQLCPLDGALHISSSASSEPYIPYNGTTGFIVIKLHHRPTTCSTWLLKSSTCTRQLLCFLLPQLHSQVTSGPLAFSEKVRDCPSLPVHSLFDFFVCCSRFPRTSGTSRLTCVPFSHGSKACAFLNIPPPGKLETD